MSNGKYELKYSRQIRTIGEPCPFVGECSEDLTSGNDCTQYEKCSELIKKIGEEAEIK
jgi:hypothetical protein